MLRRLWKTASAVLVLGLVAVACESGSRVSGPGEPTLSQAGGSWKVVKGSIATADTLATAVIGNSGGRLYVAGHELTVPARAVSEPTTFRMKLRTDGVVGVELTAMRKDASGAEVDVGSKGFNRPVQLTISYSYATNVADPSRLMIAWDTPDDQLLPITYTKVDKQNRWVYGELAHFSEYVIVYP